MKSAESDKHQREQNAPRVYAFTSPEQDETDFEVGLNVYSKTTLGEQCPVYHRNASMTQRPAPADSIETPRENRRSQATCANVDIRYRRPVK